MSPDFSKPAFAFIVLGSVRFRPRDTEDDAGRFRSDYRCQLRYVDEPGIVADARVYFVGHETVAAGKEVPVVLGFLDWERERERCRVGRMFELCEGSAITASGTVQALGGR
jgi:hypothetical protein